MRSKSQRRRILVIVNPHASTVSDRLKKLVVYALHGCYEVEAVNTKDKTHATELCRKAVDEGFDAVAAFGGDGTANEAANGLVGTDIPLMCLPGGSANVYCRMLGIPTDVIDATEYLLSVADHWPTQKVDLGQVNERYFLFSSGAGLDASVVALVDRHPRLKTHFRHAWFAYVAVKTFLSKYISDPPKLALISGELEIDGVTAVVQNGNPYSYFYNRPIHVTHTVELNSGTFNGAVLKRAKVRDLPFIGWRMLSKRALLEKHRQVELIPNSRHITIRAMDERPFPVQVDGEYIGSVMSADYKLLPAGLTVIA